MLLLQRPLWAELQHTLGKLSSPAIFSIISRPEESILSLVFSVLPLGAGTDFFKVVLSMGVFPVPRSPERPLLACSQTCFHLPGRLTIDISSFLSAVMTRWIASWDFCVALKCFCIVDYIQSLQSLQRQEQTNPFFKMILDLSSTRLIVFSLEPLKDSIFSWCPFRLCALCLEGYSLQLCSPSSRYSCLN